jgi:predicted dehydrogenase
MRETTDPVRLEKHDVSKPDFSARRVDAAVIGCGAIANEHLSFLAEAPDIRLAAVCDQSPATVAFAAGRFGASESYTDVSAMLAEARPDVVHVLTPPASHYPLVIQCLDAGAHVICEKPMTPSADETVALVDHAQRRGLHLVESRNLLFNDGIIALDRLVADRTIGHVREVDVLLSLDLTQSVFGDLNLEGPGIALPGGAVHDFLPHLCYLFLHFAEDATEVGVQGSLDNLSGNPRVGSDHLDVLLMSGRTRGRLRIASDLKPEMFRVVVRGTDGHAEIDLYHPFLRVQRRTDSGKWAPLEQLRSGMRLSRAGMSNLKDKVLQKGTYHGMPRMLAAIYQSIADNKAPPVSAADIVSTARLVDRIVALGARK